MAAITGSRKSFGCGLVNRIRSIPSTPSQARSNSPNSVRIAGCKVAAPGVDVLAEQRDLAHARPRRAASPPRGSRRDAGSAPARVQPERCSRSTSSCSPSRPGPTRARARSRCCGRWPAKCSCVPNRPRSTPIAADAHPLAEMRNRAGPERDVDLRVEVEDPFLLRLGVTALRRRSRGRDSRASAHLHRPR